LIRAAQPLLAVRIRHATVLLFHSLNLLSRAGEQLFRRSTQTPGLQGSGS